MSTAITAPRRNSAPTRGPTAIRSTTVKLPSAELGGERLDPFTTVAAPSSCSATLRTLGADAERGGLAVLVISAPRTPAFSTADRIRGVGGASELELHQRAAGELDRVVEPAVPEGGAEADDDEGHRDDRRRASLMKSILVSCRMRSIRCSGPAHRACARAKGGRRCGRRRSRRPSRPRCRPPA